MEDAVKYNELVKAYGLEKVLESTIKSIVLDSKRRVNKYFESATREKLPEKTFIAGNKENFKKRLNNNLKIMESDARITKTSDLDMFKEHVKVNPEEGENGLYNLVSDDDKKKFFIYILSKDSYVFTIMDIEFGIVSYAIQVYDYEKEEFKTLEVIDFDIE